MTSAMDTRLPDVADKELARYDNQTKCYEEGATCCAHAKIKKLACSRCLWPTPYGVTNSLRLCAPCMHEHYREKSRTNAELWPPCLCKRSLYWWAKQWPERMEHLRHSGSHLLEQVLPPPQPVPPQTPPGSGRVGPGAGHAHQHGTEAGTAASWRTPPGAQTPPQPAASAPGCSLEVPVGPGQHEGAASDAWGGGHSHGGRWPSPGGVGASSASGLHGMMDLDNQPSGRPGSSGSSGGQHIRQTAHPGGGASGDTAMQETLALIQTCLQRIEDRLQTLEAHVTRIQNGQGWSERHDEPGWQAWHWARK